MLGMCRSLTVAARGVSTPPSPRRRRRALSLLQVIGAVLLQAMGAQGEEPRAQEPPQTPVAACLEAHRESQRLMRSSALLEAKQAMSKCASQSCPALVQTDCAAWLIDVDRDIPSVVLRVRVDGVEQHDAKVKLNGAELVDFIGKPLALNPGRYEFEFEVDGFKPEHRSVELVAREKYRLVAVDFATPRQSLDQSSAPGAGKLELTQATAPDRPVPMMTWVLGGIGVAGLGGFAILGATTVNRENSLRASCEPECDEREVDALKTRYLLADISLGVGAVALAGAAVFYITRPEVRSERGGLALQLRPMRAGVGAVVEGYGF